MLSIVELFGLLFAERGVSVPFKCHSSGITYLLWEHEYHIGVCMPCNKGEFLCSLFKSIGGYFFGDKFHARVYCGIFRVTFRLHERLKSRHEFWCWN